MNGRKKRSEALGSALSALQAALSRSALLSGRPCSPDAASLYLRQEPIPTLMRVVMMFLMMATTLHAQVVVTNVSVVDVENRRLLPGYTVLAMDGKIVSVDKGRTYKLPAGVESIDGTGKYLVPGFVDAHIHFFQSGGLYARPDAIDLRKIRPYADEIRWAHQHMDDFARLYTSAGITSVIDVGSTLNLLRQRDSFSSKPYAPVIAMTGPLLTTYIPAPFAGLGDDGPFLMMTTADSVRLQVQQQKSQHADFLKIWYIVLDPNKEKGARANLPLVQAAIDEAHRLGMRVAVHATERITAQLAVESGADFLVHNVEDEIVNDDFITLLKKKKTVLCPTMIVGGNYPKVLGDNYHFRHGELELTHPQTAGSILDYPYPDTAQGNRFVRLLSSEKAIARERHGDSILKANLARLVKGGVIIATGTDAGNTGTQHVSSYFNELAAMQDAGMDLWQLLQSSTINGAKAIGREQEWGSITKGRMANMVLLNRNPLDSLSNWRSIDRVINRGTVLQPDSMITWSPEMLAQQQLNAYNAHDLEAFIAPYADDVEIYDFPGKLTVKGKDKMRENYRFIERSPKLYCRLINRIVQGNMVIDQEEIHGVGSKLIYGVAIYQIEKGKIKKVYFPE